MLRTHDIQVGIQVDWGERTGAGLLQLGQFHNFELHSFMLFEDSSYILGQRRSTPQWASIFCVKYSFFLVVIARSWMKYRDLP